MASKLTLATAFTAASFSAGFAIADELPQHDIIGDLINDAQYSQEAGTEIFDPLADIIDGLIYDGNDEMGFVEGPKFVETNHNYSSDGFVNVSPKGFEDIEVFDLSAMYRMCEERPGECPEPDTKFSHFLANTPELNILLAKVNDEVNTFEPRNDIDNYGVSDFFQRISVTGSGDCEDFVLEKEARLLESGLPQGSLRKISVLTPEGEGHEVLGVATFNGTVLLDNLNKSLGMAALSDYTFVASTTAQEPWKKAPTLTNAFNDPVADWIETNDALFYGQKLDDVSAQERELVADASVPPLPRPRPDPLSR